MQPVCWLHISDFHIRERDSWAQDVVLKAMCDDIHRQRIEGVSADFILATGDIAFAGKSEDYALATTFFNDLTVASGVPKERIFCIPGNHDIDRDRQKLSFMGARGYLQDPNRVDIILGGGDDLETLLKREKNYRDFQNSYFTGQDRILTADGLGYISHLTINDIRITIIGLDSAWLAEGGIEDHGKLLIGERQLINAVKLLEECADAPHIIIGMAHHPIHLLAESDRRPIQSRVERAFHFFHCGHLHEPEARIGGNSGPGCLTVSAGASFETRQYHNTYSIVTLDLYAGRRTVTTIQYNPTNGMFSSTSQEQYHFELTPVETCSLNELALAIQTYRNSLAPWAHYLSALLLNQKSELPILAENNYLFGAYAVFQTLPDSELKRKTTSFLTFKNALRVLDKNVALVDILRRYGDVIAEYGSILENLCRAQPPFEARLADREQEARRLGDAEQLRPSSQTSALLIELANAKEWQLLRTHAERHFDSSDPTIAIQAKRMLALSLAHSDGNSDKQLAIELYQSLIRDEHTELTDVGNLAVLLIEVGNFSEAKATVLDGIQKFPTKSSDYFSQLGQKIVEATGDRDFRKQLETAIVARGKLD